MNARELLPSGINLAALRPGENRLACPWCAKGEHDDALAVRVDGHRAVFQCFRCGESGVLGERARQRTSQRAVAHRAAKRSTGVRDIAAAIWAKRLPLANSLGAEYLAARGCAVPPAEGDLGFVPHLFCAKTGNAHPAIVARVSTARGNHFVGVHRIFLRPGSDRAIAKMRLGGADEPVVIRLWPDRAVHRDLHIAEGVETALAVGTVRTPVWAAIDAGQLSRFPPLPHVRALTIWADNDVRGVGQRAAEDCGAVWKGAGHAVRALVPESAGQDFADLVQRGQRIVD